MAATKRIRLQKNQQRMLEALEKTEGLISEASTIARIPVNSHYQWYRDNEKYRELYDAIRGKTLDEAEKGLKNNVKKDNQRAIEFVLDRLGKDRGYGAKREKINIDLSIDDDLEKIDRIMQAMVKGNLSFDMGERLLKAIQLKVDIREHVEFEERLKDLEKAVEDNEEG